MSEGLCNVEGCDNRGRLSKGMCNAHYNRLSKYGRLHSVRRKYGSGTIKTEGYHEIVKDGERDYAHRMKAKSALGRNLPRGSEIHHVNKDKLDNNEGNLVICPDHAYHALLHAREGLIKFVEEGGDTGIYKNELVKEKSRCWYARIVYNKKVLHLGNFRTRDEAVQARKVMARKILSFEVIP